MTMQSRHEDPTFVKCEHCGWIGQLKDCIHTYHGIGHGELADVEPIARCPVCGDYEPDPLDAVMMCRKCHIIMDLLATQDTLSGDLEDIYQCSKCGDRFSVVIATIEDDDESED